MSQNAYTVRFAGGGGSIVYAASPQEAAERYFTEHGQGGCIVESNNDTVQQRWLAWVNSDTQQVEGIYQGSAKRSQADAGATAEPAHAVVESGTNRRHSWTEFQEAGMLWAANRILHLFGWAIVVEHDETEACTGAYPVRTEWRGFPLDREELGYKRVSEWMARAAAALLEETKR